MARPSCASSASCGRAGILWKASPLNLQPKQSSMFHMEINKDNDRNCAAAAWLSGQSQTMLQEQPGNMNSTTQFYSHHVTKGYLTFLVKRKQMPKIRPSGRRCHYFSQLTINQIKEYSPELQNSINTSS